MRAFISLRQFVLQYADLARQIVEIRQVVFDHNEQLSQIHVAIEKLLTAKSMEKTWAERDWIGLRQ